MILLISTSDKIQVVTSAAVTTHVHASYMDTEVSSGVIQNDTMKPGRTNSIIGTATTTDVVASPGSNVVRNVKTLHVRNAHASSPVTVTVIHTDGTNAVQLHSAILQAGESLEYIEGIGFFVLEVPVLPFLIRALNGDATGANNNSAQPWFPTGGAVTLEAATSYIFDGIFHSVRSAGTTSHTTSILFGGTATLTSIDGIISCKEGDTNAIADDDAVFFHDASGASVKAASTSATENILVKIWGIVRINASGTLIPQFQYSTAPGGAPTMKAGTYFRLIPIGSNTDTAIGSWT